MTSLQSALSLCSRCLSVPQTSSTFNLHSLSRSLPSTSNSIFQHSHFSTTAITLESRRKRVSRLKRKKNLELRVIKTRMLEASKPDPVLGYRKDAEGEKYWKSSELAQLVLNKETVWGVKEDRRGNLIPVETIEESQEMIGSNKVDKINQKLSNQFGGPLRLNFGLDLEDRQLLFSDLPKVMVKDRILDSSNVGIFINGQPNQNDVEAFDQEFDTVTNEENANSAMLERVLDLRNASGKGIQVENLKRIVDHFGRKEEMAEQNKGVDTASPEVQAAVLTYRIRNLSEHLETNRHDNANRRAMTMLVHQRAKILKYLRKSSPKRYESILPRIGVQARAVEGEIVVPGKPKITSV